MTKREDPDQIAWIDLVKDVIVLVRRSYMYMYIDLQRSNIVCGNVDYRKSILFVL